MTELDAVQALGKDRSSRRVLNCAAITSRGEEMAPAFFKRVVDTNLHGTLRTAETFHDHREARRGSIINIASMHAHSGSPKNPAYGAGRAAVAQLTKSLAIACAGDGIRVNALAPGFIETEQSTRSRTDADHVAKVTARTPLGRWGKPEDIAGTVLFPPRPKPISSPGLACRSMAGIPLCERPKEAGRRNGGWGGDD